MPSPFLKFWKYRNSPYINHFVSADTIVPGYTNPQNLNRYSYVTNNPVRYTDPTGHRACDDFDAVGACVTAPGGGGSGFGGVQTENSGDQNQSDDPLGEMKPGDIISFNFDVNGVSQTYNYMLGLMDDGKSLGFWDLDSHSYISYALAVNMVGGASSWTTFKKTDPKTFNSYAIMSSSGSPSALPSYDVSWTGGIDDNPAFVEIRTQVDWENVPSEFAWAVLGPSFVTAFWGDAKPTVTPLSPGGYYPLTNYVAALRYFATDGAALWRYPVIHP
jgi:hypothetical protein